MLSREQIDKIIAHARKITSNESFPAIKVTQASKDRLKEIKLSRKKEDGFRDI